ncbi:TonB family protein [Azorhizobium sp. AG788]|uniref:TonB family protein n=1 Tax=Azorhizobium sp. AG788 TaxID=2183897 RepID=UPI00313959FA
MKFVAFMLALVLVAPAAQAQSVASPSKPARSTAAPAPPQNAEQWVATTTAAFQKQSRGAYPSGVAPGDYITVVAMIVRRDGVVTTYHLSQSSGNPLIDQAALMMVSRAGRLQPLPPDIRDQQRVRLPIAFHIPVPKPPAKKKPDPA